MNSADFAPCEAERIDAPGAIQRHGALFALSRDTLNITHASLGGALSKHGAKSLIGADPDKASRALGVDVDLRALCKNMLSEASKSGVSQSRIQPVEIADDGAAIWFLSLGSTHFILERRPEPSSSVSGSTDSWLTQLPATFDAVGGNVFALAQSTADRIQDLIGFDRVLVYRFAEDATGEVIAEARPEGMTPYLGLHYPATDIPSQARRMYLENRIREIADTTTAPIPLNPPAGAESENPVDLSTSILRAISPYHLEYMANMGVRATLVSSIVVDGLLWGLIACHHRTPMLVPANHRRAVLAASDALGGCIHDASLREAARRAEALRTALGSIEGVIAGDGNVATVLLETMTSFLAADGAALIVGDDIIAVGRAPPVSALPGIALALAEGAVDGIFAFDRLDDAPLLAGLDFAGARGAAGVLDATEFETGEPRLMLIAFREEFVRSIDWGGDPGRAAEIDPNSGELSPRKSFVAWRQTVTGSARPWDEQARRFLVALADAAVLRRVRHRLVVDVGCARNDLIRRDPQGNVVMELAMDGIAVVILSDSDDIIRSLGANRSFTRLFDVDPDEFSELPIVDLTTRLGLSTTWDMMPAETDIVLWSPIRGARNISIRRISLLETLVGGVREHWEMRVFQDITRMRRREEALTVAFERALGEARGQAEFLANMSHELRTPLNAVLGYSEVIAGGMLGPDALAKYAEYAGDIHSAGAHLLALIERLLTVSQIEADKRSLQVTRFDLGELAAECVAWVAEQPGAAKPEIEMHLPVGEVRVEADAVAMHQVAINLIGNAAKFTPATGHVDVTVSVDATGAPTLTVRDNGPGVAPDLISDLFQPFRQGEGVYARRHGGVGLGLSIVKGLMQLHGGAVRMTSQLGEGTEVIARLPQSRHVVGAGAVLN
jgi:light-regulated signal transduction histidine kinase (bacteriophytochrome)